MCGIGALFAPSGTLAPGSILSLHDAVRHRGPDGEGVVAFSRTRNAPLAAIGGSPDRIFGRDVARHDHFLALCHRRLAIIDLAPTGLQPMQDAQERSWIVYNGEIYNYIELRDELERLGHGFKSSSDTEVILAAFAEWGVACLSRFNGMFAFLLFDTAERKLYAVRDRFGVKPLYYWVAPDGHIAFASEIKQFTALPGWAAAVNAQRAYDFLNWSVLDHTDETMLRGVYQLRGGEALVLDLDRVSPAHRDGRLPVSRWYELRPQPWSGDLPAAGARLAHLLTDSIRLRMRSDVPVGSCLSGGLDSSSIVCIMNALLRKEGAHPLQQTFSACSRVARYDERHYIDEVVHATGVAAHYVYPEADELFDTLDALTWQQDEPFATSSIYAQWHVFKLAAEHGIKVMLDGQGADEQLAGYHGFFSARFAHLAHTLDWVSLAREIHAVSRLHGHSVLWGLQQTFNGLLPEWLRQPMRRMAGKAASTPDWLDLGRLGATARDPFVQTGAPGAASVRTMSCAQLTATSLPMLLHWEDRSSMAHSVEARVPFLDYRLVEFVLGLPDAHKIAGGMTKRVLRDAMRGMLPECVRTRTDKMGFVTAEEAWLRGESAARFRTALRDSVDLAAGVLKHSVIDRLEQMIRGERPFSHAVWRMVSFGSWIRVFGVRV